MQATIHRTHRNETRGVVTDPLYVTILDAVRISGLSRSEIYRRLASGDIEAIKPGQPGGRTLIVFATLKTHLAGLPRATFRKPPAAP